MIRGYVIYVYAYVSTIHFLYVVQASDFINSTIVIIKGNNTQFNTSFQSQMCNIDK